jgi:ribose transport system substrate-binding protein
MNTMKAFLILFSLIFTPLSFANYNFLVIAKDTQLNFFKEVKRGCKHAQLKYKNVRCIFPTMSSGNSRLQEQALRKVLKNNKIDGIAIAVINSEYTMFFLNQIVPKHIPIITFDADFSKKVKSNNAKLSKSYVGTDNYALGKELGKQLVLDNPDSNEICILSGHNYSSNLNNRIEGFKSYIKNNSKKYSFNPRCPLYSLENSSRSLKQLQHALEFKTEFKKPPILAIMGAWPQLDTKNYRVFMNKFKLKNSVEIYSIDTLNSQIELLKEGLSTINVGQRPFQMGFKSIETLLNIVTNKKVRPFTSTGLTVCTQKNFLNCRD